MQKIFIHFRERGNFKKITVQKPITKELICINLYDGHDANSPNNCKRNPAQCPSVPRAPAIWHRTRTTPTCNCDGNGHDTHIDHSHYEETHSTLEAVGVGG